MKILKLHAKLRELQADNHLSISCCTCENAAFEGMLCFVENTHSASRYICEYEFICAGLKTEVACGLVESE